ncbi:hypothetical protein BDN71DRAFT_1458023, partial [Pleurotus eryngii]
GFSSITQEPFRGDPASSIVLRLLRQRVSDLGWTEFEVSVKLIRKSWGALENINTSNFPSET